MKKFMLSLRGETERRRSNLPVNGRLLRAWSRCAHFVRYSTIALAMTVLLSSCAPVDLNAQLPSFDTGIDSNTWVEVPEGEFFYGQFNLVQATLAFEIMVTDVTTAQYADFLNAAIADDTLKVKGDSVFGFYPGDKFHGVKHELEIKEGDWEFIPLNDPSQRIKFDGSTFTPQEGYEDHPMTMVTWFGAWGYCQYYDAELPTEIQWEKAARGTDARPFPWGWEIARENANYYSSRDPFEDMSSFGSRTTPVGFYNGNAYDGFQTVNSASPYGLYDMAGNVWQWIGDVQPQEGFSDRLMRGGSKDTYDMDLRTWVRNSAPPMYFSPGVGFRCVR